MKKLILFVLLILALALAACGGGGGASTTINVTMTDFHFEPSTFTVPAGQQITVNATNNGAVMHTFVIMKYGTDVGTEFGPEDQGNVYFQLQVQPGEKNTQTFTAPTNPGDYQVVCDVPGHFVAGMVAKLTVVAK